MFVNQLLFNSLALESLAATNFTLSNINLSPSALSEDKTQAPTLFGCPSSARFGAYDRLNYITRFR